MIHLIVAFLVIRSTLRNIVKILINASLRITDYGRATDFSVHVLLQYGGWNAPHANSIRASEHLNICNLQR